MKIKKFSNIWTIGLIAMIVIQMIILIAKLIIPKFIVGIAELNEVVKIGEYIDSHKWAYYIFTFATSFLLGYFYICASARIKKLNKYQVLILIIYVIISLLISEILPLYFSIIDISLLLLATLLVIKLNKNKDNNCVESVIVSFIVHNISQIVSLSIRDISTLISYPNSATYFILLIDMYIWTIILYFYYNKIGGNL